MEVEDGLGSGDSRSDFSLTRESLEESLVGVGGVTHDLSHSLGYPGGVDVYEGWGEGQTNLYKSDHTLVHV